MGLLEKAESGKTPEEKTKKVRAEKTPKNKPAKVEKPKKESRMSLRSSRRRERKERKAKAEPTELPSFPDGFEPPTSGQTAFRRLVDVIVCYGWLVPVVTLCNSEPISHRQFTWRDIIVHPELGFYRRDFQEQ